MDLEAFQDRPAVSVFPQRIAHNAAGEWMFFTHERGRVGHGTNMGCAMKERQRTSASNRNVLCPSPSQLVGMRIDPVSTINKSRGGVRNALKIAPNPSARFPSRGWKYCRNCSSKGSRFGNSVSPTNSGSASFGPSLPTATARAVLYSARMPLTWRCSPQLAPAVQPGPADAQGGRVLRRLRRCNPAARLCACLFWHV
jgi:hypothetical protein